MESVPFHAACAKHSSLLTLTMMTTNFNRLIKGWATQSILKPLSNLIIDSIPQTTTVVGAIGITTLALTSSYFKYKWNKEEWTYKFVENLERTDVGIATDHLEEGYGNSAPMEFNTPIPEEDGPTSAGTENEVNKTTTRGIALLSHAPIETTQHRRVRDGRKMQYLNCILAECKNKFGTPQQNEANLKAVQRYANNIMTKHGLRPTHVREYLPMIVSMTFVPTKSEIDALAMLNSTAVASSKIKYILEKTVGGFHAGC